MSGKDTKNSLQLSIILKDLFMASELSEWVMVEVQ